MLQVILDSTFGLDTIGAYLALGSGNLVVILSRIINALLGLLAIAALFVFLYGGFLIMLSGGNEERRSKGYKTIINAVIGIFLILSSYAIVNFVINALVTI